MTSTVKVEAEAIAPPPGNRSSIHERKGLPVDARRVRGLMTAADLFGGVRHLADEMGIAVRTTQYKLNAQRGISNDDLAITAAAMRARAARLTDLADKFTEITEGNRG